MAAKRPVLAVAVAGTVAVIGFLALRSPGSDSPVVAGPGGPPAVPVTVPAVPIGDGSGAAADPTLVSAGHPSPDAARPGDIAAIVGGSVVMLDARDGHTLRTLATHPEAN